MCVKNNLCVKTLENAFAKLFGNVQPVNVDFL